MMTYRSFVEKVQERTGCKSREAAERAIKATTEVLGQRLHDVNARFVAAQLPSPVNRALRRHRGEEDFGLDEFYQRVSECESVAPGFAMEHAQVVCQVLTEAVDREGLAHLRVHLPSEWADLFVTRSGSFRSVGRQFTTAEHDAIRSGRTLSAGRTGSSRPLSESRTGRVHSGSVAAVDEPHADRKLSSSAGISSVRSGNTLAAGRPPNAKV